PASSSGSSRRAGCTASTSRNSPASTPMPASSVSVPEREIPRSVGLQRVQYRPAPIDGFLGQTGLAFDAEPPHRPCPFDADEPSGLSALTRPDILTIPLFLLTHRIGMP